MEASVKRILSNYKTIEIVYFLEAAVGPHKSDVSYNMTHDDMITPRLSFLIIMLLTIVQNLTLLLASINKVALIPHFLL